MVENVPPAQVWEALNNDPEARLVDVRTEGEWNSVGIPDVSAAGKETVLLPWQTVPGGPVNPGFLDGLRAAGLTPENHLYFICRSGARSAAAAEVARQAGFSSVFNVSSGFEGSRFSAGWKALNLPWRPA